MKSTRKTFKTVVQPIRFGMLILASLFLHDAAAETLRLDITPGSLSRALKEAALTPRVLEVTGTGDFRDLRAAASLGPETETLNLSDLKIVSYLSGYKPGGDNGYYEADAIPAYSFALCRARKIILPSSVKAIGEGAFAAASSEFVVLPESLKSLGEFAFASASQLQEISAPSGIEEMSAGVFENCKALRRADFSKSGITLIPERAFAGCSQLHEVALPASLIEIGKEAFAGTKVSGVNLPSGVKISEFAFSGATRLEKIDLSGCGEVGEGAFFFAEELRGIGGMPETMPAMFVAGAKRLVAYSLLLPVDEIGDFALAGNRTVITEFGENLRKVGRRVFHGMPALKGIVAVRLGGSVPEAEEESFDGIEPERIELVVADDSFDLWKNHPEWGKFNVVKASASGISSEAVADADVKLTSGKGWLQIEAPEEIKRLRVYSLDGRLLLDAEPGADSYRFDTSGQDEGIVAVQAEFGHRPVFSRTVVVR